MISPHLRVQFILHHLTSSAALHASPHQTLPTNNIKQRRVALSVFSGPKMRPDWLVETPWNGTHLNENLKLESAPSVDLLIHHQVTNTHPSISLGAPAIRTRFFCFGPVPRPWVSWRFFIWHNRMLNNQMLDAGR